MANHPGDARILFSSGAQDFSVADIVAAAHFRGELEEPWVQFRRDLAAESRAEANGQEPDDAAIDGAVEQFRYQYDLITAEETERWLEERSLTLADFSGYFVRRFWGENTAAEEELEALDFLDAPEDLRALFLVDLILNGELDRLVATSSRRIAGLAAAKAEAEPERIAAAEATFHARHQLSPENESEWLGKLNRDGDWLREQLKSEATYERECDRLLTREARAREISALRLPLTNFEVETIEFDSLDAAREGLLCVRHDGLTMEEVANEGRYPYRHAEVLLEDVPEDLQQKFLSVTPGEVLEPIRHGEGFHLCRILAKAEPELDDPLVKIRAEARILDRHFDELTAQHIQWPRALAPVAG